MSCTVDNHPGGRNDLPIFLLFLAALMFGLYNVFIKLSSDHIQPVLGAVALQFVAAFSVQPCCTTSTEAAPRFM